MSAAFAIPDGDPPVLNALQKLLSVIPTSTQTAGAENRALIGGAAWKAAALSGTLSLPPGPAGLFTILPDLYLIWKIQRQLVADIAAGCGKSGYLTAESLLYCLFKHGAAQALRDIVVRAGQRVLIRRASGAALRNVGARIGQRMASSAAARWLPLIGAVGVGAYAYYDTTQVGRTATELFSADLDLAE